MAFRDWLNQTDFMAFRDGLNQTIFLIWFYFFNFNLVFYRLKKMN